MNNNTILPVITLYQPWATWIMRGWKTIETRTHDRFKCLDGKTILIHAGQKTDASAINNPYLTKEQLLFQPNDVINGFILGSAYSQYLGCLDPDDSANALIECFSLRYGLLLSNINVFDEPIPVKGEMGIWYFDLETKQKVKKRTYQVATLFGL
jgi:hypothetical protein